MSANVNYAETLNVGDKVVVSSRFTKSIHSVKKITPSGSIRLTDGLLYNANGTVKGSDIWNRTTFTPLTPELEEQLKREQYIRKVVSVMNSCKELSYDDAVSIGKILKI